MCYTISVSNKRNKKNKNTCIQNFPEFAIKKPRSSEIDMHYTMYMKLIKLFIYIFEIMAYCQRTILIRFVLCNPENVSVVIIQSKFRARIYWGLTFILRFNRVCQTYRHLQLDSRREWVAYKKQWPQKRRLGKDPTLITCDSWEKKFTSGSFTYISTY